MQFNRRSQRRRREDHHTTAVFTAVVTSPPEPPTPRLLTVRDAWTIVNDYDMMVRANFSAEWDTVRAVADCKDAVNVAWGEIHAICENRGIEFDASDHQAEDHLRRVFKTYQDSLRREVDSRAEILSTFTQGPIDMFCIRYLDKTYIVTVCLDEEDIVTEGTTTVRLDIDNPIHRDLVRAIEETV